MSGLAKRRLTLNVLRGISVHVRTALSAGWLPRLRKTASLCASGGRHSGGERLKANSGNDYREVVTRQLAVPNPFVETENLCLTRWQDTREAVRAG